MSDDVLIKVENVSKKFCKSLKQSMLYGIEDIARDALNLKTTSNELRKDEFWAVDDVSFEVRRGECLGIIGRNGAGKSTLLKMLNGIFMPDKGKITVKGKVGALIEVGAGFHPMLTGRENIYVNGAILGMSKKEIDNKFDEIVEFAELEEFIDMPVKHYSSGMYVRLGFSIAAQLKPAILIIDEVLAVGDRRFRLKCLNTLQHRLQEKIAIVFVSHDMPQVINICDKAILLEKGHETKIGLPQQICQDYDTKEFLDTFEGLNPSGENYISSSTTFKDVVYGVEITNVYFKDKENERSAEYRTENEIPIKIKIKNSKKREDIAVWISIRTANDILIHGFRKKINKNYISNIIDIDMVIPSNTLLKGVYTITCGIHKGINWGGRVHQLDQVLYMRIKNNDKFCDGIVNVKPIINI